jgi:DTW domain-containing protein YfiP
MNHRRRPPRRPEAPTEAKLKFNKNTICENCFREKQYCICGAVRSFDNHIRVVILQHPQEQFKMLNSARLARLALRNSSLRVGLSWPNFKAVAGTDEQPSQWGILYLGGEKDTSSDPITVTDRRRQRVQDFSFLRGIIAIDGSWKEAKAMWWRNPWFTRLNRVSLHPDHPSLRAQVKKAGLSTIEAISLSLQCLGENREMTDSLREQYQELVIKPVREIARQSPDREPARKNAAEEESEKGTGQPKA